MRIRYWSSDGCSSDLTFENAPYCGFAKTGKTCPTTWTGFYKEGKAQGYSGTKCFFHPKVNYTCPGAYVVEGSMCTMVTATPGTVSYRSEEHTSELQSLMRISYAVFCLKNKKTYRHNSTHTSSHNTNYTQTIQNVH